MLTHLAYIDDSGTKEYAVNPELYNSTGCSRYFVFGAVLISTMEASALSTEIKQKKIDCFGTDQVEMKSTWLRIPKYRSKHYLEPFKIDDKKLTMFTDDIYKLISQSELQLIASVVDKVHVQEDYPNPWYAPAIAYEILMQRVVSNFQSKSCVRVIIDDMTGKTPKKNSYKDNLMKHHEKLRQHGSSLQRNISFASLSSGIKFVNSAHSQIIQIADIISYNVYRQFVQHGELWESKENEKMKTYEWLGKIGSKFRTGPSNRVQGYGIIKFPLRRRVKWSFQERK